MVPLLAWFLAISCLPDPRPLSAPDWSVRGMQALIGLSEPAARAVSTIVLRGIGFALIGVLLSLLVWRRRPTGGIGREALQPQRPILPSPIWLSKL